jgi:hypothetical protein
VGSNPAGPIAFRLAFEGLGEAILAHLILGARKEWLDFSCCPSGHNGSVPLNMTTDERLDWIIETLKRIEARQIALKAEVDDVQTHEPPTVGSFATVDTDKKA